MDHFFAQPRTKNKFENKPRSNVILSLLGMAVRTVYSHPFFYQMIFTESLFRHDVSNCCSIFSRQQTWSSEIILGSWCKCDIFTDLSEQGSCLTLYTCLRSPQRFGPKSDVFNNAKNFTAKAISKKDVDFGVYFELTLFISNIYRNKQENLWNTNNWIWFLMPFGNRSHLLFKLRARSM